eukprot:295242-Chlamydomonas_euryale.AAC.10
MPARRHVDTAKLPLPSPTLLGGGGSHTLQDGGVLSEAGGSRALQEHAVRTALGKWFVQQPLDDRGH